MVENSLISQDKLKKTVEEESNHLSKYTDIIVKIIELEIRSKIILI